MAWNSLGRPGGGGHVIHNDMCINGVDVIWFPNMWYSGVPLSHFGVMNGKDMFGLQSTPCAFVCCITSACRSVKHMQRMNTQIVMSSIYIP